MMLPLAPVDTLYDDFGFVRIVASHLIRMKLDTWLREAIDLGLWDRISAGLVESSDTPAEDMVLDALWSFRIAADAAIFNPP